MSPQELARLLEREHLCEICRLKMATGIFDRELVCEDCRRAAESKLVRRG